MNMIRPDRNRTVDGTAAPARRVKFSGVVLLASGMSVFLMVVMTGFTLAMTMIWPG
jgi:hypothetical protein